MLFIFIESSVIISEELSEVSKAISFKYLVEFVNGLDGMSEDLTYMKTSTNELRVNASMLNDGLRRVKNDLLQSLRSCNSPECNDVRGKINQMSTTIDFDKVIIFNNMLIVRLLNIILFISCSTLIGISRR